MAAAATYKKPRAMAGMVNGSLAYDFGTLERQLENTGRMDPDLYALPPLTGEGLTGDTILITIIVQSDDVNGTHAIASVGSGTYTAVVNGATVSFRFIEGADGVGSLLISGFPEGTVVGTMHLTLGPVELTLVIHPAVVGA